VGFDLERLKIIPIVAAESLLPVVQPALVEVQSSLELIVQALEDDQQSLSMAPQPALT
jgi:hypothetical protein